MKRIILIVFSVLFIAIANSATATLVHTEAQATMSKGFSDCFPTGTVLNASITYDIGPGGPSATINSVEGTFSWNEGATSHVFEIAFYAGRGSSRDGASPISCGGIGPIVNG